MTAMLKTVRMVTGLTTGLNVSSQSIPGLWLLPFATRRALYLDNEPSAFNFFLNSKIQLITLASGGHGSRTQVLFEIRAVYSSFIALSQLGSLKACK